MYELVLMCEACHKNLAHSYIGETDLVTPTFTTFGEIADKHLNEAGNWNHELTLKVLAA